MSRRALYWTLLAALVSAPAMVHAQAATGARPAPATPGPVAVSAAPAVGAGVGGAPPPALVAERQRLRTELDRVNSEIDALKRDGRGLRDDYRLRSRMADAEALARRLTEVDARLQATSASVGGAGPAAAGLPPTGPPAWPAPPQAQPSDDRAALEAKADILADQARRLNGQVEVLAARVTALRGRQELRRRAGQLERDPFSQMDQGKRRLATSGGAPTLAGSPSAPADARGDSAGPPTIVSVNGPPMMPVGSTVGVTANPQFGTSTTAGSVSKAQPLLVSPSAAPGGGDGAAASVATQFNGILDASTLAEIRRLELGGTPGSGVAALERALTALRARATQLTASADALRSRAKTAP